MVTLEIPQTGPYLLLLGRPWLRMAKMQDQTELVTEQEVFLFDFILEEFIP